ncbi:unnamed protein product [Ixodes pacificus]
MASVTSEVPKKLILRKRAKTFTGSFSQLCHELFLCGGLVAFRNIVCMHLATCLLFMALWMSSLS